VVADDSMLTREGLVRLLGDAGVEVVGVAGDADQLFRAVALEAPDAAVIDIRMPPTHTDEGLVAAERLRERHPGIGTLVLSQYVEPAYALRLLDQRTGGAGYLLKERVFDVVVVVDALRRVCDGETVVDPTIVARLLARPRRDDPVSSLTDRERQVLALVAEGRSNRSVAESLSIAERTVEAHVTAIFAKFGLLDDPTVHRRVLAVLSFLRSAE
jgi:DNA-binding NarL/FixJ family response regulator